METKALGKVEILGRFRFFFSDLIFLFFSFFSFSFFLLWGTRSKLDKERSQQTVSKALDQPEWEREWIY